MQYALENGIDAQIISEKNRIRLLGLKRREIVLKKEKDIYSYKYVSMIPVSEKVTNVNTTGMKYNVNDYADNKGKKESKICLFIIKSFDDVENLIPMFKEICADIIRNAI